MGLDLTGSVSQSTLDKVNNRGNKPEAEPGFENGVEIDAVFDDLDLGYSSGDNIFGSGDIFGENGGNLFGNNAFGNAAGNSFGDGGVFGGVPNALGQPQQQQQTVTPKRDMFDDLSDTAVDALKASGGILKSMSKSIFTKNLDDFGSLASSWCVNGIVCTISGIALKIIAYMSKLNGINELASMFIGAGIIGTGVGVMSVGISALGILQKGAPTKKLAEISDTHNIALEELNNNFEGLDMTEDDLDDESAAVLDDFLNGAFDDDNNSVEDSIFSSGSDIDIFGENDGMECGDLDNTEDCYESSKSKNDALLDALPTNVPKVDRRFLLREMAPFFATNTDGFESVEKLNPEDEEYQIISALVIQSMAATAKKKIEEIDSEIDSVTKSLYCIVVRATRCAGINKTDEFARELESFFRKDSNDIGVVADVVIERGMYKITITTGETAIVTVGDCLKLEKVYSYFSDNDNELPFVAGIDQYGEPLLANGKNYTTMMIVGKQRSGKSWYVNSVIVPMMAFNTPEDVEFVIIDPKKSNLFKTIACLPHVVGLHSGENTMELLNEIVNNEGERRKEILSANRCDTLWDLRKRKHIKIPAIYIVIDEYMTLMGILKQKGMDKDFEEMFNIIITQLPFVGIHILFVPHRAQGVVDRTARAMIMFSVAVRTDKEIVKETLDEKKWERPLTKVGDAAIKLADIGVSRYIRGIAIATSDADSMELIEDLARAWYRIGADIPDNSGLGCCVNRDEDVIADILGINDNNTIRLQYNKAIEYEKQTSRHNKNKFNCMKSDEDMLSSYGVNIKDIDSIADRLRSSESVLYEDISKDSIGAVNITKNNNITPREALNKFDEVSDVPDDLLNYWRSQVDAETNERKDNCDKKNSRIKKRSIDIDAFDIEGIFDEVDGK